MDSIDDTPDVGLTEQERERIRERIGERVCWRCHDRDVWSEVERLIAARVVAERERADAAALLALAAEIADGRVQRPGMQRRRQWADRIRAALGGEATP